MRSSSYAKIKLRLLDRALELGRRPNRIDRAAVVSPSARATASNIYGPVRVDDYARLHRVELSGPITIGRHSSLWGPEIYVLTRDAPVEIGNFCSIARHVSVHGYGHDPGRISTHFVGRNILGRPIEDEIVTAGPTRIGHDVWIGAGGHVLPGVSIGTGAIIGAGSVVARDVPPYAIAVGTPAKPTRFRFDDESIKRLLASEWWSWSDDKIRSKAALFTHPLTPQLLDEYL